ncbi:NADH-quinone oxidoreductase subunit NuoF [Clostridium gasigenes]|uniref:NADH-quinone oxidoreductase subunit NuoF n=1 Tax=Clostridium gasigenes TaxID=94869 RepID=UPI0014385513|nr:NADH-quinone oxidoreductase subunit NuoF [Clostridium gasigenes]NKF05552.1 NADH-quinone oxidoreductase subunit NuoF [Clostridium gasigenes]QSW18994.1 NADH-quinone oxidoreductase subunit NuoF [Clostridium gasigenes]
MERIYDYKSLLLLKSKYEDTILMRKNQYTSSQNIVEDEKHIMICGGTGCKASNSDEIIDALNSAIVEKNLEQRVKVVMTGCFGFCAQGPIVQILPDKTFYIKVTKEDAEEIINKHIIKGEIIDRLLYKNPETKKLAETRDEIPFYKRQKRIALRNCGIINPENIEETIGSGGYMALGKVLTEMTKEEVIQEITDSGLRGRGGGGFPTGIKWGATLKNHSDKKYVICNADEGDPGAFMDRSILEGDPHSVLEAMAICAYAIGSDSGYIYIRAEYPLAILRLEIAIRQANYMGLLGENILGTGFNFNIKIKYGAGAFVCGEETALIQSVQGLRGEPTLKPPRACEIGLWNKPTCVNNVETFANVTSIINNGAKWYKSIGTEKSPGTKIFSLAGKINNVGLVEVPMGISLKEIIYDIGGGVKDNKKLKGVQTGGPSGGCIPASLIDIPIEYDTLIEIGSMMGSGGMIVIDEENCMVDIAKFYLDFIVDESCGKCTPCRIGTKKILELLNKITAGEGTNDDLNNIKELCEVIKETALCGLGDSAPNPVLSTMKYFMDEYKSHIEDKHCRAGVCKQLLSYEITDKCIGCTKCARNCPQKCITGRLKERHILDSSKCIKCGLCLNQCPVKAIIIK